LLKQLWTIGWAIWDHRNMVLYKKTNQMTQRMEDKLYGRVRWL
jgi:hypothetical protein